MPYFSVVFAQLPSKADAVLLSEASFTLFNALLLTIKHSRGIEAINSSQVYRPLKRASFLHSISLRSLFRRYLRLH